jgi:hypothetical protein
MTGQLQTTLRRQAEALESWDADLDAIVLAGERRVRRRWIALVGSLAGALVIAGGVAVATQRLHAHRPQPVDDHARPVSYALGSVIHSGDTQVDVGMPIASFVRYTDGFVFSDPQQRVYAEQDGHVHLIGHLVDGSTALVAGEDGREVAWYGHDGKITVGSDQFAKFGNGVYLYPDFLRNGRTNSLHASFGGVQPITTRPTVRASWDGFIWLTDGRKNTVVELRPDAHQYAGWPAPELIGRDTVQDAAARRLLVRVGDGLAVVDANLPREPALLDTRPKPRPLPSAPQVGHVSTGDLAPDARHWFNAEGGRFTVYASSDGSSQEPGHPGFERVTPYQWLGTDTIAALAHRAGDPDGPISILRCRVSTNACIVAVADAGPEADVIVPSGPTTGTR